MALLFDQVVWSLGQGICRFQPGSFRYPQRVVTGRYYGGYVVQQLQALSDHSFLARLDTKQCGYVFRDRASPDHEHSP